MSTPVQMPGTKRWYKKKSVYIVGIIALLIGGGVFANSLKQKQVPLYETVVVEKGSLTQTVDASGNVESADELDLRFESSGRIAKVYTEINKEVRAGTLLADLNLSEVNARIGEASAGVGQAQANLSQIKAAAQDAITNAEAAVEKALINLKLSEGGADSQIVRDAYNDAFALIVQIQASVSQAITAADNILGIDNEFANDAYEPQLAAEKLSALVDARNQYIRATADQDALDLKANTLSLGSSQADIDASIIVANKALISTKDLLYQVSEVLNASPTVGRLTQTLLDGFKSSISSERASITAKLTTLISQGQEIQSAKNSYTTNNLAYEQAKQNLINAKNKAAADVVAYEASIRQSQASVGAAVATRNKSRIIAPIAGKVAKVAFKSGEFVTSQDVVIKLVSPRFEVKVDIPETDIVKIATGVSTTVTLDAYGTDVKFTGVVTEIESGETVIQDVVYYKVTVVLEEKPEYQILNGMTADVVFFTENKDNVLFIPQRAIRSEDSKKLVRVLENGQVREVEVETGLRGDDGLIEIVSGLEAGQEIVIREKAE
ncbi:MAG TPA: efflux RND transporter periplasmic adaptor subunit [Candidatus Magasanikbacteria bacterium]|nr:efflux RND transporter periplasmic adaptor subunit [Candidatus Magasanikbacteria bacterium]